MKSDLRILLASVVGAAIGLIVGYTQRSPLFHGVDFIDWIGLVPLDAFIWLALGALSFGGLWTLFSSKVLKSLQMVLGFFIRPYWPAHR